MARIPLNSARDNCSWLALALSLFISIATIGTTLLISRDSHAFEMTGTTDISSLPGAYQSPQHCQGCHEAEFEAWSGTSHADASFDPIFQVFLQKAGEPEECFSCHTTGYNSATGQFVLAGVTCEACHGPYREGHSAATMKTSSPEELCGACHRGTLSEWASSHHGKAEVTCTACHEVHTQKTRSIDNTNTLCAGCHQANIQNATHTRHNLSDAGIHCIDCHLARPGDDAGDALNGQAITAHSFGVFVTTCADCHPSPLPAGAEQP